MRPLGVALLTGVEHGGPDSGFVRRCGRSLSFMQVIILLVVFLEIRVGHRDTLDDEPGGFVCANRSAIQVNTVSEGDLV
eukprot:8593192-Pyramimonas_sp.AAC.1